MTELQSQRDPQIPYLDQVKSVLLGIQDRGKVLLVGEIRRYDKKYDVFPASVNIDIFVAPPQPIHNTGELNEFMEQLSTVTYDKVSTSNEPDDLTSPARDISKKMIEIGSFELSEDGEREDTNVRVLVYPDEESARLANQGEDYGPRRFRKRFGIDNRDSSVDLNERLTATLRRHRSIWNVKWAKQQA